MEGVGAGVLEGNTVCVEAEIFDLLTGLRASSDEGKFLAPKTLYIESRLFEVMR